MPCGRISLHSLCSGAAWWGKPLQAWGLPLLRQTDSPRSFDPHGTLFALDSWLPLVIQGPAKEAFVITQEFPVEGWSQGGWMGGPPRPDWPGTRAVRKMAKALSALSHHRSFLCYRQKTRPESYSLAPSRNAWRALKIIPMGTNRYRLY